MSLHAVTGFSEVKVDDTSVRWADWRRSPVEFVKADIRDAEVARRVAVGADVVVHLAANTGVGPLGRRSDAGLHHQRPWDVELPRGMPAQWRKVLRVSLPAALRSASVLRRFTEELPAHPVSPYGASKLAGEAYCSAYARSFGIETVALRFGNCYGPLSKHKSSVVAKFIREALAGASWEIYGDGNQTRDFIFVEDIAEAIILAATADAVGGEVFQIASNGETTVLELATKLAKELTACGIVPPVIRYAQFTDRRCQAELFGHDQGTHASRLALDGFA